MLSPIVDHTFVREGFGQEGEIWCSSPQWQSHKQRHVRLHGGPRKGEHTRKKDTEYYWANIEKRNQINTKNYWK